PRVLHSFPTRRSSDLGQGHVLNNEAGDDPEGNKQRRVDGIADKHRTEIKPWLGFKRLAAFGAVRLHFAKFSGVKQCSWKKHFTLMTFRTCACNDTVNFRPLS